MRIFEYQWTNEGEKEYIAANTVVEAIKTLLAVTDNSIYDLEDEDEIVEVPKEKWADMKIINMENNPSDPDDKEELTFAEWMLKNPKPDVICGTMYP